MPWTGSSAGNQIAVTGPSPTTSKSTPWRKKSVELLIRFQPVASDMRRVISTMKLSVDLERVADESVAIARRAKQLNREPAIVEVACLEPLAQEARNIFHDGLHAFVKC